MHRLKQRFSIRFILLLIFLTSIMFPVSIVMYLVPTYYKQQMTRDTIDLTRKNLQSISDTIIIYLSDLQKLAALPYLNQELRRLIFPEDEGLDTDGSMVFRNRENVEEILPNYLKLLRKEILSIIIITDAGTVFHYNRNQNAVFNDEYSFPTTNWYDAAIGAEGSTVYLGAHNPDYFSDSESLQVFSLVRSISFPYDRDRKGLVLVDADMEIFKNAFRDIEEDESTESLLMDQNGNILYATTPVPERVHESLKTRNNRIVIDGEGYNAIYESMPVSAWTIVSMFSENYISGQIRYIYYVGFFAAGLTLLLTYFLFFTLSRRTIARPIAEMSQVMKEVASGDLSARCAPVGTREIASLGENLNSMVDQLDRLIIRDYQLAIDQKNAEYRALQAQIKPHFLYNTLNGLIGLNRIGDRKKLEQSIINLTSMMRYSLSDEEKGLTSLDREIRFIMEYCDLQKLRFEEKMTVEFDIDSDVLGVPIPKLLIQPIVENAVLHNIETSVDEIEIRVEAKRGNAGAIIRVSDNGRGFVVDHSGHSGTGIQNVRDRLDMYDDEARFSLESEPGKGTIVEFFIPSRSIAPDAKYSDSKVKSPAGLTEAYLLDGDLPEDDDA